MSERALKDKNGEHPFGDAGQLISFAVFLTVWAADSFFLHSSTSLARHIPLPIRLALLALTSLTAFLLFKSARSLIHFGERQDHVYGSGAFHYVRHPVYVATLLFYFGMSIATASLLSLAVLAAIFFFYNYIAGFEEKLLEDRFGDAYKAYKKRTGRWLPRIGKLSKKEGQSPPGGTVPI